MKRDVTTFTDTELHHLAATTRCPIAVLTVLDELARRHENDLKAA